MLFADFPDGSAVGEAPKLDAAFEYREAIRLAVARAKSNLEHDVASDKRCDLVNGAVGKWGYGMLCVKEYQQMLPTLADHTVLLFA